MSETKPRIRVPARRGQPIKISESLLELAKRSRDRKRPLLLEFPDVPPSVKPASARIAQDEAPIQEVFNWASAYGYSSAFAEGTTFLGYAYLSELALRPEYRFMSEIIAGEMTRKWVEFRSVSDDKDKTEKIKDLTAAVKEKYDLPEHAYTVIRDDGFMGRGHIYINTGVDLNDRDADKELLIPIGDGQSEISRKKCPKKTNLSFKPVEAVWTYPTQYNSNDPLHKDWYRPRTWYVMRREVHRTRFLTVVSRPVPDILKPAFAFGGLALSQMAKPYVDNWLRTRQSVSDLIHAFTVWVVSTNLGVTTMADGDQLFKRLDLFNLVRDNHNVAAIDKDTELLANVSAPLGGLDALQAQSQEHMFSVSRIPGVKFAGLTPTGLNASSEGEIRAFYDTIHDFQERIARPFLTPCFNFVQLAEFGEVDDDIVFDFPSLWELDEAAEAAVQQVKASTHEFYMTEGVVASREVRKAVAADPKSPYAGLDLGDELPPGPEGEEDPIEGGAGEPNQEDPVEGEKPKESPFVTRLERQSEGFGSPPTMGFKGDLGLEDAAE